MQDRMVSRVSEIGSWVCLAGALFYLLQKSVFLVDMTDDYQFIWLAGDMWRSGLDPYSTIYTQLGQERFIGVHPPEFWFYPPNWWPVAWLAASTSFETGILLWRSGGALCLLVGMLVLAHHINRYVSPVSPIRRNAALIYICLMSATPIAMSLGQTTFLSFLGLVLFISAYVSNKTVMMIFALTLLMLKPQIGLPFGFFLLPQRAWFPAITGGAVLTVLIALPAFQYVGLKEFLDVYTERFAVHGDLEPNHALAMTGIRNFVFEFSGATLSTLLLTLVASAIALGVGVLKVLHHQRSLAAALVVAITCLFVPLHLYDMMLVAVLVLLAAGLGLIAQALVYSGLLFVFRSNNLAELTGLYDPASYHFIGPQVASIGLVLLLAGPLVAVLKPRPANRSLTQANP